MQSPMTGDSTTIVKTTKALSGTGALVLPIFGVTGDVYVVRIWGIVLVALGNHTAAYWRLNDAGAQPAITLAAGTVLTAAPAGSKIVKTDLAGVALAYTSSATCAIVEPAARNMPVASSFGALQKTGGVATNIEYLFSTTDAPNTTGTIQFFAEYQSRSDGAKLTPL